MITHGAWNSCPLQSCHVLMDEHPWKHFSASPDTRSDALPPVKPLLLPAILEQRCCTDRAALTGVGLTRVLRAGFVVPYDQDVKELLWAAQSSSFPPPQLLLSMCPAQKPAPGHLFSPLALHSEYFDHVKEFNISF